MESSFKLKKIAYFSTGRCNSHCYMCGIHKVKQERDLSPNELKQILADELFRHVRSVGVSGGEPSLHSDWKKICLTLVKSLPKLRKITITTNCVDAKKSIDLIKYYRRICNIYKIFNMHKLNLSILLSLDGVGAIHDNNRGVDGNFQSWLQVCNFLKQKKIDFTCACTITTKNVDFLRDLDEYCTLNNIKIRYRLASIIGRLYNSGESFNNFNEEQKEDLIRFFSKMLDSKYNNIYTHIINMLQGNRRIASCPHTDLEAVCLSNNGDLLYCSVASPILGNCLKESALTLYRNNLEYLSMIREGKCLECTHDIIK